MTTRQISSGGKVLSLLISENKEGNIYRMLGYNFGSDNYLQLHDSLTVPAGGAIPLRTFFLQGAFAFEENWGGAPYHFTDLTNGLIAVVSSTEDTLTAAIAGKEVDLFVDLEDWETRVKGATIVGDLTTGVKNLAAWLDVDGPKRLLALEINNNAATNYYVMIFAKDFASVNNGDIPLLTLPKTLTASVLHQYYNFGQRNGLSPFTQNADGTKNDACAIVISSTANTVTKLAGNDVNIKAWIM